MILAMFMSPRRRTGSGGTSTSTKLGFTMAGEMNLYPALQRVVLTCTNVPLPEEDERAEGRELRFRPNLVATPQIRGE